MKGPVQTSDQPSAAKTADWVRTRRYISVVFVVGALLFGYGLAVTLNLLPVGWGTVAVFQFILLTVGALLVSLMTLVVLLRRQTNSGSITRRQLLFASLTAPLLTLAMTVALRWVRRGELPLPGFLDWTLLGLVILSLQIMIGTVRPVRRRQLVFFAEAVVVFVVLFGVLVFDRQELNLASYLLVSGGAVLLLILFGGPLYLLGNRLNSLVESRG